MVGDETVLGSAVKGDEWGDSIMQTGATHRGDPG